MNKKKSKIMLSVVLATRNEQENIRNVLNSVLGIAGEIIVMDEESSDKTREIAKELGARVFKVKHEEIFHKTKQKAIDNASGEWILQLDADEIVSKALGREILEVMEMNDEEILARRPKSTKKWNLFMRHQRVVEKRDGVLGHDGEVVAFFIPRRNFFLGKPLSYAGVYPDAVIRLIKRGKARLPAKSVHEQMEIDGRVAWLFNDIEHRDSPSLGRYLSRMNRYTDLRAREFAERGVKQNIFNLFVYSIWKPLVFFLLLFFRHKGYKDGVRGFLWSAFSAAHFPLSYYKYWTK